MKIQHDQIINEARNRGYDIADLSGILGPLAVSIANSEKSELVFEGTPLSLINLRSLTYFDNKQLTKHAFEELDIPFPTSLLFKSPEDEALATFFSYGKKYVCKPPDMTEGIGVEMNISSMEELRDYWRRNHELSNIFMLEEQVEGDDLRAQVIGGRIVAACTREPAHVFGNGIYDLSALIEQRLKVIKSQNPMNDLVIDHTSMQLLHQQKIGLTDIPVKGRKIILKELANMSQGAHAIDIVETLHPVYQEWTSKICNYLNVDYFAIDIISRNFAEDPYENAIILEINAKPEWLHHTFSERRQHNIAAMVLDHLFG
ncbi:MAG: hypothetical protein AAF502_21030 [Bacteroidota bacterium]